MDSFDYINASFIDVRTHTCMKTAQYQYLQGYGEKKNAYIAAQGIELFICEETVSSSFAVCIVLGPVEVSVERFWRMIWEYEVPTIVMLTQCSEAGKVCMSDESTCEYIYIVNVHKSKHT